MKSAGVSVTQFNEVYHMSNSAEYFKSDIFAVLPFYIHFKYFKIQSHIISTRKLFS
jgi:hypothetical protein